MVNFYCDRCGLYITVPSDFAGGRGCCPRCRTFLRIPRPLPANHARRREGLRYLAYPESREPGGDLPAIVRPDRGPSNRYACSACGEQYESVPADGWTSGACPQCGQENEPVVEDVAFPRQFASDGPPMDQPPAEEHEASSSAGAPGHSPWDMEGEYLIARPADSQDPSESVIVGVALDEEPVDDEELLTAGEDAQDAAGPTPDTGPIGKIGSPAWAQRGSIEQEMHWSLRDGDRELGPLSTQDLRAMMRSGDLPRTARVFRVGMDDWQPIYAIPGLSVLPRVRHRLHSGHGHQGQSHTDRIRHLLRARNYLLWMLVGGGFLVALVAALRPTFRDMGRWPFLAAHSLTAVLILLALTVGLVIWVRDWALLAQAPGSTRRQGVAALGGMAMLVVVTAVMGIHMPKGGDSNDLAALMRAQYLYDTLSRGEWVDCRTLVHWGELEIGAEDFGGTYQSMPGDQQEQLARRFVENFSDRFNPHGHSAGDIDQWHVERHTPDGEVIISALYAMPYDSLRVDGISQPQEQYESKLLLMTLRNNRLKHIEMK